MSKKKIVVVVKKEDTDPRIKEFIYLNDDFQPVPEAEATQVKLWLVDGSVVFATKKK